MKKIIVIGCPGSGKSTFSRALHKLTGLPLYHLDLMYWNEDKTIVNKEVFLDRLNNALSLDEWIIDGNYSSSMEMRIKKCDTIVFLDYPLEVCLEGVKNRKNQKRSDMPWVETEDDLEFIEFIKKFNTECKPKILELLSVYSNKTIYTFNNRESAAEFLNAIK